MEQTYQCKLIRCACMFTNANIQLTVEYVFYHYLCLGWNRHWLIRSVGSWSGRSWTCYRWSSWRWRIRTEIQLHHCKAAPSKWEDLYYNHCRKWGMYERIRYRNMKFYYFAQNRPTNTLELSWTTRWLLLSYFVRSWMYNCLYAGTLCVPK